MSDSQAMRDRQSCGEQLNPESLQHTSEIRSEFAFQGYIEKTEHRAVTQEQLERIIRYASSKCSMWHDTSPPEVSNTSGKMLSMEYLNLYHLNSWLLMPATRENDCAFVELLTGERQLPTWFVSHWWGERITDFLTCICKHVEVRELTSDTAYWVCAYANRQHSLHTEVVANPKETSFFRAMDLAKGVLLLLDDVTETSGPATPFTRIWCAFEVSVAMESQSDQQRLLFDIVACKESEAELITDGLTEAEMIMESELPTTGMEAKVRRERSFPIHIIEAGLKLRLEMASASVDTDRIHILNAIAGRSLDTPPLVEHANYDAVNLKLRAIFAISAWRPALEQDMVEQLNLPYALAADRWRKSLCLDFASCWQLTDSAAESIGRGFPNNLNYLALNFYDCKELSDTGLASLARHLPSGLLSLSLDFSCNDVLSDDGLTALSENLPLYLQQCTLSFYECRSIGDGGILALSQALPNSLVTLSLDFEYCEQISSIAMAAFAEGLPATLRELSLIFRDCFRIDDLGLKKLGEKLPGTVKFLELCFRRSPSVSDKGVQGLVGCLPAALHTLKLNFRRCELIGDVGVASLSSRLPNTLHTLALDFHFCSKITNAGLTSIAGTLGSSLRVLWLNFMETAAGKVGVLELARCCPRHLEEFYLDVGDKPENVIKLRCPNDLQAFAPKHDNKLENDRSGDIRQQIKGQFKLLDSNCDGRIHKPEVIAAFSNVLPDWPPEDVTDLVSEADKNGDGFIDYVEFIDWLYSCEDDSVQ